MARNPRWTMRTRFNWYLFRSSDCQTEDQHELYIRRVQTIQDWVSLCSLREGSRERRVTLSLTRTPFPSHVRVPNVSSVSEIASCHIPRGCTPFRDPITFEDISKIVTCPALGPCARRCWMTLKFPGTRALDPQRLCLTDFRYVFSSDI